MSKSDVSGLAIKRQTLTTEKDVEEIQKHLEPGDIILYGYTPPKGISLGRAYHEAFNAISRPIQGDFAHSGLYVGDGKSIESLETGVTTVDFKDMGNRRTNITVLRPKKSKKTRAKAVQLAQQQLGKAYSFRDLARGGINLLSPKLTKQKFSRAPGVDSFTCSTLIADSYRRAGARVVDADLAKAAPVDFMSTNKNEIISIARDPTTSFLYTKSARKAAERGLKHIRDFGKVQTHVKEAKKLTSSARNRISQGNFALSGRRYPIHDRSHAQNALARVSQHGTGAERRQVRAAVKAKYPSMGKEANQRLSLLQRIRQSFTNPASKLNERVTIPVQQSVNDFITGAGSTPSQVITGPGAWAEATGVGGLKQLGVMKLLTDPFRRRINKLEAAGHIDPRKANLRRLQADGVDDLTRAGTFAQQNIAHTAPVDPAGFFQMPDLQAAYQTVAPAAETLGSKAQTLMAKGQLLGTDLAMNAQHYMDPVMDALRMMGKAAEAEKVGDHVTERAMERTNLTKREVHDLRQSINKVEGLERGKTYHVDIPDRGYVVVGDVGKRRKKHVAKTVLGPHMRPPGEKLELDTLHITSKGQTNKQAEEKLYRPRVDAIVHKEIDGKPHVLVAKADYAPHDSSRYSFPGGGIDPGQNAHQAAQMELMEEAGVRGKNFTSYGKQTKLDLDSDWQARQFKKRGELWHGIDNQVVVGEYKEDDSSLHGSQGDFWKFEWEDAKEVEKELRKDKSQYAQSNQVAADALRDLRIKRYGQKAAYLSKLSKGR